MVVYGWVGELVNLVVERGELLEELLLIRLDCVVRDRCERVDRCVERVDLQANTSDRDHVRTVVDLDVVMSKEVSAEQHLVFLHLLR